jgi:sterol desaturase/sphingolipid hydroxylase (fatty acid hydroxylase superfamily)
VDVLRVESRAVVANGAEHGVVVAGLRLWRRRVDYKEAGDSIMIGLTWAGTRMVGAKALAFAAWVWTWQHLALFDIDLANPLAWVAYWIAGDFVYYWTHRLEHRVRVSWCSHLVHHSSEEFNLATAVCQPRTEAVYKPVVALWAPLPGFHPANARYLDRNFGGSLVVWDKLFGTYEPEGEAAEYGVLHYERPDSAWRVSLGGYPDLVADMRATSGLEAVRLAAGRPVAADR